LCQVHPVGLQDDQLHGVPPKQSHEVVHIMGDMIQA
jgi:hypothetical protein